MKLKLENPNSELFIAIILLKILDVATTYYAVKYFGAEEMKSLSPLRNLESRAYDLRLSRICSYGFTAILFSAIHSLHGKLKGKRSSQDALFCSVRLLLPDDAHSRAEQHLPASLGFGIRLKHIFLSDRK